MFPSKHSFWKLWIVKRCVISFEFCILPRSHQAEGQIHGSQGYGSPETPSWSHAPTPSPDSSVTASLFLKSTGGIGLPTHTRFPPKPGLCHLSLTVLMSAIALKIMTTLATLLAYKVLKHGCPLAGLCRFPVPSVHHHRWSTRPCVFPDGFACG